MRDTPISCSLRPLKYVFVVWEILFFSLGSALPVYAEEATSSATLAIDRLGEATQSAVKYIHDQTSEGVEMPNSLPLPFETTESPPRVTSWFDEERQVFTDHSGDKHNGIDFDLKEGTPVTVVDDGEVTISGENDYGITVAVEHSWGKTIYGHLKEVSRLKFKNQNGVEEERVLQKGDKITRGQAIGLSGSTGDSTGPHLHFGIKIDGEFIDPSPVLGVFNNRTLDNAMKEATSTASLSAQILEGSGSSTLEDLRKKAGFLYNHKFNLSEKTSIHFDHKKRLEPGFAVVDENEDYKLRFFLKEDTSSLPSGFATQENRTLKVKENDLGFLRVRSEASTSSEELGRVDIGQEFTILESKSSWYKIEYQKETFGWVSGAYTEVKNNEVLGVGSDSLQNIKAKAGDAKVFDNKIEYPVIISGIAMTLRYTLSQSGVKEEFIINEKPDEEIFKKIESNLEIPFSVENEGLEIEKEEKGGYKFNLDGGDYWQILPPNIKDSKSEDVETKPISASLENDTYTLAIDKEYLKAASYPVIIDPTVVVNTSSSTTASGTSSQRHVVTTSDGTIHNFTQVGTQTATCGGVSKSGLLWFTSSDSGATWVCQAQLSSDTSNQMFADVHVDSSDNIYTVYSIPGSTGGTAKDVFYQKLTKGSGATWTVETAQMVLDGTATVGYSYASLDLEGTTRIWLASRYFDGTNYQVVVYYSDGLSAAPTWTASQNPLDTTPATVSTRHIPQVVRFGSKIGVIYNEDGAFVSFRSRADGDTLTAWSPEIAITNQVFASTFSAVGDSSGNIYVTVNRSGSIVDFVYFNGSTWSTTAVVSSTAFSNLFSNVTTDGAGNVWVFYGDANGLNSGLSGSRKLVYKKGVAPYTAANFDTSATPVVSYHRTFDKYWSYVASAYTDDTTDAASTTATDTQMVTSTGDIAYFGSTEVYDSLSWDLTTSGVGGTIAWEYCSAVDGSSNCTTWSTLTFTASATSNFTADGYGAFTAPADWVAAKVNSEATAYYYVRARATGNYSTTPVGAQMAAIPQINWGGVPGTVTNNSTPVIWTENSSSAVKVRSAAVTTTANSASSATAEISPTVAAYGASNTTTQASTQRHLVKTSDGTMHLFIQAANSTSVQQQACGGSTSSSNNTGLMWLYSTDSGSTWVCGGQMSSDTTNLMYADARADSSDNIYVVYSMATSAGGTAKDVYYRKLTKGSGATWTLESAQLVLDGTSTVGYHYATLELEGTTRIWLAARYFDGTNYQVSAYYSDGLSSAPSWTVSQTTLDTAGVTTTARYPTMVRFGSKIGVIYNDQTGQDLYWRYRSDSDGLTTWQTEALVVVTSIAGPIFTAIGDSSGNIYLAANSSTNILFTFYNGSSWSSSATVSSAASNSLFTSIAIDDAATPNVYVLYGQTTGLISGLSGNRNLVYKKGVSPYATADFDTTATGVNTNHTVFDKVWSYVSAAFTDETTDAGNVTVSDVTMPSGIGDIIYYGKTTKFDALSFSLTTAGTVGQVVWEYYNGSTWMPLVDYQAVSAPNFTASGYITFTPHSNWTATTVNGEGTSYYYVRARAVTAYSVTPVGAQMAAIPQISWGSLAASTDGLYAAWTENAANPSRVRYSTVLSFNTTPDVPSSLGPGGMVNGSASNDTTPQLTFTLSDADSADTLKYQIQIDDSADFSSPVTDYTSALAAQGQVNFTVGQTAGSGTYTTGSAGQVLSEGSYYWRVKAIDENDSESAYSTANSGSVAFVIDTTSPNILGLISPGDGITTNNSRPGFTWRVVNSGNAQGLSSYTFNIDNVTSGDINITGIPVSRTSNYVTQRYIVQYSGFEDSDANNNYLTLYTQSSTDWEPTQNNGELNEGRVVWSVTVTDDAGNTQSSSRALFVDFDDPTASPSPSTVGTPSFSGMTGISESPSEATTTSEGVVDTFLSQLQKIPLLSKIHETSELQKIFDSFKNQLTYLSEISGRAISPIGEFITYHLEEVPLFIADLNSGFINLASLLQNSATYLVMSIFEETSSMLAALGSTLFESGAWGVKQLALGMDSIFNTGNQFVTLAEGVMAQANQTLLSIRVVLAETYLGIGVGLNDGSSALMSLIREAYLRGHNQLALQLNQSLEKMYSLLYKGYETVNIVYQASIRPLEQGADFAEKVRIGALTFKDIVFNEEPIRISNVTIEESGKDYAIISWETNHYATGKVNYGTDLSYGNEVHLDKREQYHRAVLTGLEPGKRYYFEVMSQGKDYVYDAFYSFETSEADQTTK